MSPDKYLRHIIKPIFNPRRTKEIFKYNPNSEPARGEDRKTRIYVYDYNPQALEGCELKDVEDSFHYLNSHNISWINIDGFTKPIVDAVCQNFGIHNLIGEDILSVGQRPKMDEIEGIMYCLLNMLYFNEKGSCVEQEQISIVLGKNFVITFQEDAERDVFNVLRDKLKLPTSKIRQRGADYLFYNLLDTIVDHYFVVMEKLGGKIEELEEQTIKANDNTTIGRINSLRKELLILKRNVAPVRDLINALIRSESELLDEKINKYFKDVYDHIVQANEVAENYREIMTSIQDLYINEVNLKMNEAMKVMAIVTCLFAPAAVIGGIYGMNFENIPFAHSKYGFYITVAIMLIIPLYMLRMFKKRGWF
jgi:magnesium transporter